jgi:ribosomal protein S25
VIQRATRAQVPATIRFVFGRGLKRYLEKRDEEFKAWTQEREEKSNELREETREFNREILLRNEKVYTRVIAQMEENMEQIRANTQAVLSMLDRINGSSA